MPARGGSKRFPGKNLAKLDNKSLILHTLETVSPHFEHVIFSSDSEELLAEAQSLEKKFPHLEISKRPSRFAIDTSKVIDTVEHYFKRRRNHIDQIWLALPTCPMRTENDVLECQSILDQTECDGVLTVTDYEFPPTLALQPVGIDDVAPLVEDWHESQPWQKGNTRTQDHLPIFRPNGALYGMDALHFDRNRNFYKGRIRAHFMPRERSVDIDNELDLVVAEAIKKWQKAKQNE